MQKDTEIVASVIREGYQDATTSALDRMVAEGILKALRDAGWATPDEVRAIVAGAGGRVEVPFNIAVDPPPVLTRWQDVATDATILITAEVSR